MRKALDNIRNIQTRDQAARSCAVALATAGQIESARKIAEMIYATAVRDDALKQIAKVE
jgi:hypothetical protein